MSLGWEQPRRVDGLRAWARRGLGQGGCPGSRPEGPCTHEPCTGLSVRGMCVRVCPPACVCTCRDPPSPVGGPGDSSREGLGGRRVGSVFCLPLCPPPSGITVFPVSPTQSGPHLHRSPRGQAGALFLATWPNPLLSEA